MTYQLKGIVKIIHRDWSWMYTKEQIAKIIEEKGIKHFGNEYEYIGYGNFIINK